MFTTPPCFSVSPRKFHLHILEIDYFPGWQRQNTSRSGTTFPKVSLASSFRSCLEMRKIGRCLFFFADIGDARHLYATMIDLHASEKKGTAPLRKYHFVATDINKCALTRDLVTWKLIDDLSILSHDSNEGMVILATIFFIYEANIMPNYIYEYLRMVMEKILGFLQKVFESFICRSAATLFSLP